MVYLVPFQLKCIFIVLTLQLAGTQTEPNEARTNPETRNRDSRLHGHKGRDFGPHLMAVMMVAFSPQPSRTEQ